MTAGAQSRCTLKPMAQACGERAAAAQRAHTGMPPKPTSHGRPMVVPNLAGTLSEVRAMSHRPHAITAAAVPPTMPIVGAKSEIVSRVRLLL